MPFAYFILDPNRHFQACRKHGTAHSWQIRVKLTKASRKGIETHPTSFHYVLLLYALTHGLFPMHSSKCNYKLSNGWLMFLSCWCSLLQIEFKNPVVFETIISLRHSPQMSKFHSSFQKTEKRKNIFRQYYVSFCNSSSVTWKLFYTLKFGERHPRSMMFWCSFQAYWK